MTGWIANVVPDQTIESAWGNSIRDRTVTPFTNAAARTSAITAPKVGMLTWLADLRRLEIYDGTNWGPLPGTVLGSVVATGDATSSGTTVVMPGTPQNLTVGSGPRRLRVDIHGAMATPAATNIGRLFATM